MLQNVDAVYCRLTDYVMVTILKLVLRFGCFEKLALVITFSYCIPIFTTAFPFKLPLGIKK